MIVAKLAITETISWGILYYTFAVVLSAMEQELHWSHIAMAGAFSVALLDSGIAAPLVGRWLDHCGPRLLMTAGSCIATGLVLAWSRTKQLLAFYLLWAGIGITMATLLYEPAFVVVNAWFVQQCSRALSIVTFLATFATTIFIPLAAELNERFGWRAAQTGRPLLVLISDRPCAEKYLGHTGLWHSFTGHAIIQVAAGTPGDVSPGVPNVQSIDT